MYGMYEETGHEDICDNSAETQHLFFNFTSKKWRVLSGFVLLHRSHIFKNEIQVITWWSRSCSTGIIKPTFPHRVSWVQLNHGCVKVRRASNTFDRLWFEVWGWTILAWHTFAHYLWKCHHFAKDYLNISHWIILWCSFLFSDLHFLTRWSKSFEEINVFSAGPFLLFVYSHMLWICLWNDRKDADIKNADGWDFSTHLFLCTLSSFSSLHSSKELTFEKERF